MCKDSKNCKLLIKPHKRGTSKKEIPFRELKHLVWERDGFKCRLCGSSDNLTVHHIKEGDDLDCMITLCTDCHSEIHR